MVELLWPDTGVAQLVISRPDRGNAFSQSLVESLAREVDEVCHREEIHTVLFSAVGADFSTGMDLSGLNQETDESLLARFLAIEDLLASIWSSQKRTVAIVQGRAWGAAADLVLACDLRLGYQDASFRFPGAQFGLVLGSRRLACRIGSDLARQTILQGLTIRADRALAMGMIHALVDEFDAKALPAMRVDGLTRTLIMRATRAADDGDQALDLDRAALIESASRPGLRDRMLSYLGGLV